jgi:hypothetical protein
MLTLLPNSVTATLVRIVEFFPQETEVYHPVLGWSISVVGIPAPIVLTALSSESWLFETIYSAPFAEQTAGRFRSADGSFEASTIEECRKHFDTTIGGQAAEPTRPADQLLRRRVGPPTRMFARRGGR